MDRGVFFTRRICEFEPVLGGFGEDLHFTTKEIVELDISKFIIFLLTQPEHMAIFTLESLGLGAGRGELESDYDAPRSGCNHSGIDYSTNQRATKYLSAIYGKIVAPRGGNLNTITVKPFGSDDIVQYLHSSEILVEQGQIVYPWTKLGKTGMVGGDSTGIHLHLQVVKPTGTPKYPCWSRNLVNPSSWSYRNPIIGRWEHRWSQTDGRILSDVRSIVHINSDLLHSANYCTILWTMYVDSRRNPTCTINAVLKYDFTFTGYKQDGLKVELLPDGTSYQNTPGSGECGRVRLNQTRTKGMLKFVRNKVIRFDGVLGDDEYKLIENDTESDERISYPIPSTNINPDIIVDASTFKVRTTQNK